MNYRRKSVNVVATQVVDISSHPSLHLNALYQVLSIETDFGFVPVEIGDWVIEINSKIKILKDEYFKEHYEVIPDYSNKPKLIFTNDCV